MENKYKVLSINIIIFASASFMARLISFLLIPLYTNNLTTAEYGQAEIILNFVNLIMPFLSLSINDSFLRFGLDETLNSKNILKTTSRVLFGSTFIGIFLTPFLCKYLNIKEVSLFFICICISQMFRSTYCLYAKIVNKNDIFAYDTIIYTFFLGMANIIFIVIFKLGIKGYLSAYILANIISLIFLITKLSIIKDLKEGNFDKKLLIEMLKYSIPMIANAISWWILLFSDKLMLEYYLSNAEVGIYSVATKIPNILAVFVNIFSQAWMISSVVEYTKEDSSDFYSIVFKFFMLILSLSTCGLLCIINPLIKIFIGENFYASIRYIPLLIEAAFFGALLSFTDPLYRAVKKNIIITLLTISAAVCNIIFNFIFIPNFGIMGAVMSTLISYFLFAMVKLYNLKRYINFHIPTLKLFLVCTLTCLLAIYITNNNGIEIKTCILLLIISEVIILSIFHREFKQICRKIIKY